MLYLLDTNRWSTRQGGSELPDTLPGWSISFLALQRDWVTRVRLVHLALARRHSHRRNMTRASTSIAWVPY